MISQVKGLLWLLLSVILLLLGSSAAMAPDVLVGAVPTDPEPCCDVWCQSGQCWWEQSCGFAPPGLEHVAVLLPRGWGPSQGRTHGAFMLWTPTKQSGCCCCWKIKQLCKQSGRAFTFTRVFWSMPKRRTWNSAYGKGEMYIYSIKSRPYGEILQCKPLHNSRDVPHVVWLSRGHSPVRLVYIGRELDSKWILPIAFLLVKDEPKQNPFALLLKCYVIILYHHPESAVAGEPHFTVRTWRTFPGQGFQVYLERLSFYKTKSASQRDLITILLQKYLGLMAYFLTSQGQSLARA